MTNGPITIRVIEKILILLTVAIMGSTSTAIAAVPAAPTLYSPSDSATVNGTLVTFNWNSVSNVTSYWLEISEFSDFLSSGQSLYVLKNVGNYTSDIYSSFPDNGKGYYWHVRACNGDGCGAWSATWYFTNGPSAVPSTPSLLYPSNNASINGPAIQFQWVPAARASSYTLEIAYDPTFTITYYTYDVGTSTSYTPDYPPMPDNGLTYYWRVAAGNSRGATYSSSRSLISGPSGPPLAPTLEYPDDRASVNDNNMSFDWNMDLSVSYRAADYRLQVATDSAFNNNSLIFDQWIGDDVPLYSISGLLKNGQYYWRVKARNSNGQSAFSSYRWFVYDDGFSCAPTTDGRGIGVIGNILRSGMATCRQDANHYYLIDTSRRTLPKGLMAATESIRTKDFHYGWGNVDNDNNWSETTPSYKSSVDAHFYAGQVYEYLYDNSKG